MTETLRLPSIDCLPLTEFDLQFFQEKEKKAFKLYSRYFQENDSSNLSYYDKSSKSENSPFSPPLMQSIPKLKGAWSNEEDIKLKEAVSHCDPILWDVIAESVPGRTPIQCKERWLYRLHPEIKKTRFEKWEDELIIHERNRVGNHWTLIANKLPGRTSCAVKNRWYSVLRNKVQPYSI